MSRLTVLSMGLLAFGACTPTPTSTSTSTSTRLTNEAPGRSAYFSLVDKGTVPTFYNRLATAKQQLVATAQPVPHAHSVHVTAAPGERLVVVELQDGAPAQLPGERTRIGPFAVISTGYDTDLHAVAGHATLYGEELATTETHVPSPTMPLAPRARPTPAAARAASTITIDRNYLETHVRQLSGDLPVTIAGQEVTIPERRMDDNKANARAWLRQEYEALGYTVSEVDFRGRGFGHSANFVAEKAGSDPSQVLIISSHLDSVGNAGADDNGAGTISALGVARALKDAQLKYSLRFLAFDEEEIGLVGSAAYAKQLHKAGKLEQVMGVINMEMTGYNSRDDGAFHIIDCNEGNSATLSEPFRRIAARDSDLRLNVVDACTNRSDHASFWRYDRPAVVFSQNFFGGDPNPCYHKECDKVDIMNFDYMTRMTTLLARVAAELVVAP